MTDEKVFQQADNSLKTFALILQVLAWILWVAAFFILIKTFFPPQQSGNFWKIYFIYGVFGGVSTVLYGLFFMMMAKMAFAIAEIKDAIKK